MSRLNKIVPDGWLSKPFKEVFEFLPSISLSRNDLTTEGEGLGYFNIHYGDIHSTYNYSALDCQNEVIPAIQKESVNVEKLTLLQDGDIVIADASEDYEGVAATIELNNVKDKKITAGLHTFAARDCSDLTTDGIRPYLLRHPWVRNELKKIATGSKVYGVSKTNLGLLELILPPIEEQQKIAKILSKWDTLIEEQEKLIKAKEQQKKGLMQKLLTGELRFPGFDDEWETVPLSCLCTKKSSSLTANSLEENQGEYRVYGATGFLQHVNFYNEEDEYISIVKDGAGVGRVLLCEPKSSVLGTLEVISPKKNTDIFFLYSILRKINFQKYVTGSTIPHVYFKDYSNEKILKPSYAEQQKIASILSSLDLEIRMLKNDVEAIRIQKKGLMQQLLTGKIRVKV